MLLKQHTTDQSDEKTDGKVAVVSGNSLLDWKLQSGTCVDGI